jgi:hypothetical protein
VSSYASVRARLLIAGALALGTSACMSSHALFQTAHTTPPLGVRVKAGGVLVQNEIDDEAGRSAATNASVEPGVRVGVTDSMDLGLQPWMGAGAALDAKLNVLHNDRPLAVAPRVSLGAASESERSALAIEAGVIASYRATGWLEPYAAVSFANHWFDVERSSDDLGPREQYASRRGHGDGLVKAVLGIELSISASIHASLEYGHWAPAQNDIGDGYALLSNDIVALALQWAIPAR